jgi:hypothetical protein
MKITKADDIAMLKSSDKWPGWPFLPIKRYVNNDMQAAVIWAGEPLNVIETNLFDLPKTFDELKKIAHKKYESPEAIVEDGWMVD